MSRFWDGVGTTIMLAFGCGIAYGIYENWKTLAPGLGASIVIIIWLGVTILAAKDMEDS